MRAFGLLLVLVACTGGDSPIVIHDPDGGPVLYDPIDLAAPDLTSLPDDPNDPCGPKEPGSSNYGCAYLTGSCPTPGLACVCWERGTMVCQADRQWELILDVGHCPDTRGQSLEGRGCLGASATCGSCSCDPSSEIYHCGDGGA